MVNESISKRLAFTTTKWCSFSLDKRYDICYVPYSTFSEWSSDLQFVLVDDRYYIQCTQLDGNCYVGVL